MATHVVAVYEIDLAYGGREEGGWWYQRGSLVRISRTFRSQERAYEYCRRLNARLRSRVFGPNRGKREISSVLSDGEYQAEVHTDCAPKSYPERRPHYE
jgi:hypothetical protein